MSSPVAPPVAAPRVVRAAAGRRALDLALRVTLLVGGLIALGLLCGGRAHAAEGVVPAPEGAGDRAVHAPAVTDPATPAVTDVSAPAGTDISAPADASAISAPADASTAEPTVKPTAEPSTGTHVTRTTHVARTTGTTHIARVRDIVRSRVAVPVGTRVAQPLRNQVLDPAVRDVRDVREVVRPVGGLAKEIVSGLVADAPPRFLPRPPSMPGLPGVPGTPGGAPGPSGVGAHTAPATGTVPRADTAPGDHARHGAREETGPGGGFALAPAHGMTARATVAKAVRTPVPTPAFPSGSTVGQSAGDGSSTRHCDLAAAAFGSGSTARLLSGATAPAHAAPTRDRQRDIPEFPG
ncbi:hypothetical protein ACFVTY_31655 [Streptomyces sp. NPDC058067]|uniref:hypothetical protein n=1 Tax=Streptomyces sp. NPDC058067 TaxID=3346324 RepID=UPI0036E78C50